MTPVEAKTAREEGVRLTSLELIKKIEGEWEKRLAKGHSDMWVHELDHQVDEVVELVVRHFKKLGYGFDEEKCNCYAGPSMVHRMRIVPLPPKEPGVFSQLIARMFGGQHAR
jgi:hypothetical protein